MSEGRKDGRCVSEEGSTTRVEFHFIIIHSFVPYPNLLLFHPGLGERRHPFRVSPGSHLYPFWSSHPALSFNRDRLVCLSVCPVLPPLITSSIDALPVLLL